MTKPDPEKLRKTQALLKAAYDCVAAEPIPQDMLKLLYEGFAADPVPARISATLDRPLWRRK